MSNLNYSRLGQNGADFQRMMQRFGVVTVMNVDVYETPENLSSWENQDAGEILSSFNPSNRLCHIDTLKVANATQEGPSKTVTGGQYSNPLIKFGKSMRLEMQDALGDARALDALCGTVSEASAASGHVDYDNVYALHVTEDFNGAKTLIGDTFFIEQHSGAQIKAKIIFYQFMPDSLFNLTQDAEGDATVFDMNGDLLTTTISIHDNDGHAQPHGVFYSIIDPSESTATALTITATVGSPVAVTGAVTGGVVYYSDDDGLTWDTTAPTAAAGTTYKVRVIKDGKTVQSGSAIGVAA